METLEQRQSTLVKAMRFPLIVLVLYVHSLGFYNVPVSAGFNGWNAFHFVSELISHNLGAIAVCWFYTFSGYYFFISLNDDFSLNWVWGKWKTRVNSLLIPYLFWNVFIVLATLLKEYFFSFAGIGGMEESSVIWNAGPLYWFWSGPSDYPLYFVRNLILMSLVAPLLYCFIRWAKWPSLVLLTLLFFSPFDPEIPGIRAIFFFGIGSWLGVWKYNMLELSRKVKWPAAVLALVLLLLATCFNSSRYHEWLLRAFYPLGMITFMNICDSLIDKESRRERMCRLSGTVFFIYAAHEIFILGWTKGIFLRLFGNGLAGAWVSYIFVPAVVLAVCILLFNILNHFMPRAMAFACGGRSVKK